jgi:hypothetical protein
VILHRLGKDVVNLPQPILEDAVEPEEDRQIEAAHLQPVDQVLEVDRLPRHVIELAGVRHSPAIDRVFEHFVKIL